MKTWRTYSLTLVFPFLSLVRDLWIPDPQLKQTVRPRQSSEKTWPFSEAVVVVEGGHRLAEGHLAALFEAVLGLGGAET